MRKSLLFAAVSTAVVLSACGGGGGGGGGTATQAVQPPNASGGQYDLNVLGVSASAISQKVQATDPAGSPLSYTIVTPASVGHTNLDPTTGTWTYTIDGNTSATSDSFVVRVANPSKYTDVTIRLALHGDPLLSRQWYIQNTGADAFASVLPVAGNDMNVAPAWSAGYSGKGIKVAIVDTGLEATHEDLAPNFDLAGSYNFLTGTHDPSPDPGTAGFDHGTSVAGIIAAAAFNGKGTRGVAYSARLRGYNLLQVSLSVANFATAMGAAPISADNDVFNASFARVPTAVLPTFNGTYNAVNQNFATLRGGKGAALVNAAGNSFYSISNFDVCAVANYYGVSCHDPATDERLGGTTPIIVGALNAAGKKSSYSSTGSSLWVSAPGGEYGVNQDYLNPNQLTVKPSDAIQPAIVTTARTGCANAPGAPQIANALDAQGANALAPQCQYTAQMNGTSSAAPNTTATIALMLEANPNLTPRDIKYILAKTARKVDPNFAGVSSTTIIPGKTVVLEPPWRRNAAGYWFSNWYGFGAVDAGAAVQMAKTVTSSLPAEQSYTVTQTDSFGAVVPALDTNGFSLSGNIAPPFNTVEEVVVFLNIAQTPTSPILINNKSVSMGLQCVQIEMTSPSGTNSVLLHAGTGLSNTSVSNARILTNAFYGEPAAGNWKLSFYNYCNASQGRLAVSATDPQRFLIVGH